MESKDEDDSVDQTKQAASIEELRIKRLAYFSNHQCLPSSDNNAAATFKFTQPGFSDQSKGKSKECEFAEQKLLESSHGSFLDSPYLVSSQRSRKESGKHNSLNHNGNVITEPKISLKTPYHSSSRGTEKRSVSDSQDYNPISVFNSQTSFSELGLSTHRPESISQGSAVGGGLEGCVYVPNPNGPGKMAKDIFGDKASEQMRNALGDQGFEDLLSKVNKNLNLHREQLRPSQNDFNANNRADLMSLQAENSRLNTIIMSGKTEKPTNNNQRISADINQSASGLSSVSKNPQLWKDGEKKVHTLSRNYDQVTVPKNTRNSFSADEIYQQAFGAHQDPSCSYEKDKHNGRYYSSLNDSPWNEHLQHSYPMDFHSALKRRFSLDGTADTIQNSSPRYQLQMAPLAYPPMHIPPPGYSSSRTGHPLSPHSAGSSSSPFAFHAMAHPSYFYHNQFRTQHNFPQSQFHNHMQTDHNQFGHQPYPPYMPQSPSSMPHSTNGFHYPPPPYNGGPHSVPRFPHGVPLHLPPPPIPSQLKQSAVQQTYPTAPLSARRGSLSFQGAEEGIKIPHPPTAPPALKLKDNEADIHPGLEHRRITVGSSYYPHVPPRLSHNPHHYSWEGEGNSNNYNLQRYFSSMETHHKGSASDNAQSGSAILSSRSVEGDFYKATERSPEGTTDLISDGEDNENENDDAASCSSGFTSVTANTMTTGKAGGLTRRLENLGVDLEHLRHLRVVDRKQDQETSDAVFEKLSKGIRYCPECSVANKAYMDWCLGCGEILIGVEPALTGQKSKQRDNGGNNSGTGGTDKKSGRGSSRLNKSNNGEVEQCAGGGSFRHSGRPKSRNVTKSRSVTRVESYTPQESPESGKGLSLSSSPVRYRREHEEAYEEPKDSGRASSNDAQERIRTLARESEEDSDSADDLEVMDEEDFVEEEGVEYDYQDSEPNFFEQIKDPVLREFIISYRNKQIMKEGQTRNSGSAKDGNDDVINSNVQAGGESKLCRNSSEFYDETVKESMAVISKIAGTRTSQFNFEFDPKRAHHVSNEEDHGLPSGNTKSSCEDSEKMNNVVVDPAGNDDGKKKKRKKKKKKKVEPMDVEIFGYEEIRQSRNSSRASNTHSIPLLNLAGSSEEEVSSNEEDDDEDNEEDNSSSDNEDVKDNQKHLTNTFNSSHNNRQPHAKSPQPSSSSSSWKNKRELPQPQLSSASVSANDRNVQKPSQAGHSSSKEDANSNRGRVFYAGRGGRQGEVSGYQRHWARSSTSWGSYHPRELSTRSSLNVTGPERNNRTFKRVGGAEGALNPGPVYATKNGSLDGDKEGTRSLANSGSSVSSNGGGSGIPVRQRPSSADYSRRAPTEPRQRPSSAQVRSSQGNSGRSSFLSQHTPSRGKPHTKVNNYVATSDTTDSHSQETHEQGQTEDSSASPRLLCPELHRLPPSGLDEENAEKLHAMAKNSYDKLQQMTPRISGGEVSIWQCLPDELWLYVFEFVSHGDLCRLMRSCQYFYRLTNDETLWKYITVRPKLVMSDVHLAAIAQHRPISMAMVMCNGRDLSQDSLHSFFRETQDRLKELNICGCSHGSLGGSFVLETAAQYCRVLTHLDASYCNLTDASLEAIAMCADGLESLCVNGFQSMSDTCLLKVLKKHGRSLRTLELYACFSLSASSLRSLGEHCISLKKLCLGSCNKLTDSAMVTLSAHLARIEELDLRGCKNLKNDCIRKIVRNCPRLSRLVLANCPHISDLALTEIATHLKTTLRTLELCGCNNVTDQGLTTLAKNCDRLVSVDISSTRCSSISVYQLASNSCSRWLETVKLSFLTPLTEASVVSLIRQCPRLQVVHVFGCTSLRNLGKLRQLNKRLSVEGDENFTRFSHGAVDS